MEHLTSITVAAPAHACLEVGCADSVVQPRGAGPEASPLRFSGRPLDPDGPDLAQLGAIHLALPPERVRRWFARLRVMPGISGEDLDGFIDAIERRSSKSFQFPAHNRTDVDRLSRRPLTRPRDGGPRPIGVQTTVAVPRRASAPRVCHSNPRARQQADEIPAQCRLGGRASNATRR
jgi:hypothetical protein